MSQAVVPKNRCAAALLLESDTRPCFRWVLQVVLCGNDGRRHRLSRYYAAWDEPRPESFRRVITVHHHLKM